MDLDYDQLFPGRFMKSGEFQGRDVTLTIRAIRVEALPQDKGGERERGIISFEGTKKELVLNRTNGECIKGMFGRALKQWVGKRVTFYPAPHVDNFTGEKGTAIRVRGSPDIAADMVVEVRLPRKRPIQMTMRRTGQAPTKPRAGAAPAAKAPPQAPVTTHGPPPDDVPLPGDRDAPPPYEGGAAPEFFPEHTT